MPEKAVIIVAGGSGTRMKSDIPKQFMEVQGLPVIMHTIRKFHAFDNAIYIRVVLPETHIKFWENLIKKHNFSIKADVKIGGETRFHSVKNGLAGIQNIPIIGIHDAVRPLVSNDTLTRCYREAGIYSNAIPVVPVKESLRQITVSGNEYQDRSKFLAVQTPQVFTKEVLEKAFHVPFNPLFTDDASVVEASGVSIHLVEGNAENIKITDPTDLIFANALLQNPHPE